MRLAFTGPCAAALLGVLLSAHPAAADTELIGAIKRSDVKAVRALLQRPVDVGAPDGMAQRRFTGPPSRTTSKRRVCCSTPGHGPGPRTATV